MAGLTTAGSGIAASTNCNFQVGVRNLWLANADDISGLTFAAVSAGHTCTSIAFAGSDYFEEFNFKKRQASFTEELERRDNGTTVNTATIEIDVAGINATQLGAAYETLQTCRLAGVVELYDGRFFLVGADRNTEVSSSGAETDLEMTGYNQNHERGTDGNNIATLVFASMQTDPCYIYDGSGDSATTPAQKRSYLTTGTP